MTRVDPKTARRRSPLATSAGARVMAVLLLCVLLWITVAWALDWFTLGGIVEDPS
ncbi:hypothetical protein [Azospirillum cavernae]|uniref:hypothetical protein n=1 Tax=Azospirillum cavernae TaxID=2320860 RepID=UPI001313DB96|nr:hypothetical protein [Azospirillum cavernae]